MASDSQASYQGNDVLLNYDLPVDTAIMGGELIVNCPLGNFKLNVPPYTNNGSKFKLKNKGPKGADLLVKVHLNLPMDRKENLQRLFKEHQA